MTPRQRFWLYCIAGDVLAVALSPGQPRGFYILTGLVVAAVASALAGTP